MAKRQVVPTIERTARRLQMCHRRAPNLWSPEQSVLVRRCKSNCWTATKSSTRSTSYFGMRKIEVKKDAEGINRLWLNNKVVFQYGPLDQGWWPDGLYTAPTDEALKYDIEMTKKFGMNMIRKHVKVEPARWYYWCDKLGMLVWQDMVSGDAHKTDESKANYRTRAEGDDRRAAQSSVDRDVGAVQRRLGPARYAGRSSKWVQEVRPVAAGERSQRLDRQGQRRRFGHAQLSGPGNARAGERIASACSASSADSACRCAGTPGSRKRTGATCRTTNAKSLPTLTLRC